MGHLMSHGASLGAGDLVNALPISDKFRIPLAAAARIGGGALGSMSGGAIGGHLVQQVVEANDKRKREAEGGRAIGEAPEKTSSLVDIIKGALGA